MLWCCSRRPALILSLFAGGAARKAILYPRQDAWNSRSPEKWAACFRDKTAPAPRQIAARAWWVSLRGQPRAATGSWSASVPLARTLPMPRFQPDPQADGRSDRHAACPRSEA